MMKYDIEHYATTETKELSLRRVLSRSLKVILQKIDALDNELKELESALSMLKDETTK